MHHSFLGILLHLAHLNILIGTHNLRRRNVPWLPNSSVPAYFFSIPFFQVYPSIFTILGLLLICSSFFCVHFAESHQSFFRPVHHSLCSLYIVFLYHSFVSDYLFCLFFPLLAISYTLFRLSMVLYFVYFMSYGPHFSHLPYSSIPFVPMLHLVPHSSKLPHLVIIIFVRLFLCCVSSSPL